MAARYGRVDCSASSYVATCGLCPSYRGAPQDSKSWALADLAQHRRTAHPTQASAAERQRRLRASR